MGVFCDKYHSEIYIADRGNDQIVVLDAEGLTRVQVRADQELKAPLDVVVDRDGHIYVSQMGKDSLQLFDFRGGHLADLRSPDSVPFKPGRLCRDASGKLYAVDRQSARVLVYGADGAFLFQFGGKGEGQGKFRLISGVAVDSAGRIYVTDSRQNPVQVFDRTGKFLLPLGHRGPRDSDFSFPGGISIDRKDRIWIVDTFKHHVKVLKADGSLLFQFGRFGTEAGQFFFPVDIALDVNGRIYVLEKGANRLQVFEMQE